MKKGMRTIKPIGGPRDKRHGTAGCYTYWGCRCEKCVEANRISNAEWRAEKLANLTDSDHGKYSSYIAGCRCEKCRDAARAASQRKRVPLEKTLPKVDLSDLA